MNIAKETAKYKRIIAMAEENIAVASQNLQMATRLKSEAESRLMELADSTGGGRKARKPKHTLSAEETIKLKAQMMRKIPARA